MATQAGQLPPHGHNTKIVEPELNLSHNIAMRLFHALFILLAFSCQSEKILHLDSSDVRKELSIAYLYEDRGNIAGADSIYKRLLSFSVYPMDSINISGSYLSVLRQEGDYKSMLLHVNRAFPFNNTIHRNLLRRYSYRMQAFMGLMQCDSVRTELDNLFHLVGDDSTLQLSMADLIQNRAVVDSICPTTR